MRKEDCIQNLRPRFKDLVARWGFAVRQSEVMQLTIERWLTNFESCDEVLLAFKIAEATRYVNDYDIREIIAMLAANLAKQFQNNFSDVVFFPLGQDSSSSGSMYMYQYAKELGWVVTDSNFPYDDFHNYEDQQLVFFDDLIGSGNQAIKFARKHFVTLGRKPYYAAIFGIADGIAAIRNCGLYGEVFVGKRLPNSDAAFHPESTLFSSGEKEAIKNLCSKYGSELYPSDPFGYDNSQALIAFSHNTPNNTLPIIWAGAASESTPSFSWHPLFPRRKIIRKRALATPKTDIPVSCPSFSKIHIDSSDLDLHMADMFYNAMPSQYADITHNYDIQRTVYCGAKGMRATIRGFLEGSQEKRLLCSLKGKSGSGKSTILKRLASDFFGECDIYDFNDFRYPSIKLAAQLIHLVTLGSRPIIIVFDDASRLKQHDSIPSELFSCLQSLDRKAVLVFSEQENAWNFLERTNELRRIVGECFVEYKLGELDDTELRHLAAKTIEFEKSGEIQDIKCVLPIEDRLALCSEVEDRLIVVSLLMMRYGRHISAIVETEYESIPTYEGKNAYALLCLFDVISLSLPGSILLKAAGDNQPATNKSIHDSLQGLVSIDDVDYSYRIRNSAITRYLFRFVFSEPPQIAAGLLNVIDHVAPNRKVECDLLLEWFSRHGFQKSLFRLLGDVQSVIDFFEHTINNVQAKGFSGEILKYLYSGYGLLRKDVLHDNEGGIAMFDRALQIDSTWAFCLRQNAWAYRSLGDDHECSRFARAAANSAPDDPKNLADCGYLLSLGDIASFKEAGRLYRKAISIAPGDPTLKRRLEHYENAEGMLEYVKLSDDDLLPDYVAKELRPGPFFWRLRKGANSKECMQAIVARLSSAMQDNRTMDSLDLDNEILGTNIASNKLLNALYKANSARTLYNNWYQFGEELDIELVKDLFEASLQLWPKEPIVRAWYSTFLKEALGQYDRAEKELNDAIANANDSKLEHFHDHPLLLNNKALLYMDGYYRGLYGADVLSQAQALLEKAIRRVEKSESNFHWPYDSMRRLQWMQGEPDGRIGHVV